MALAFVLSIQILQLSLSTGSQHVERAQSISFDYGYDTFVHSKHFEGRSASRDANKRYRAISHFCQPVVDTNSSYYRGDWFLL